MQYITETSLREIHRASVRILEETGMRFLHPEAIALFQKNGLKTEGDVVYFTEEQLMRFVSMAPEKFTVYARNPRYNMEVGGDVVNMLCGTGPALVGDLHGNTHVATLKDHVLFTKLYEQNPHNKTNGGGILQPREVDPRHRITTAGFLSLLYSEKVIEAESIEDPNSGIADFEEFIKLLQIGFGISEEELKAHPRCVAITDTNSPLLFDQKMVDMLIACAKYCQPVAVSACSMAGTTGPVTLAGNLAVTNAEVLAGIALAQMVSPHCPVLYGCQSTIADMRSGRIAVGAAESALTYGTAARLARMYGLPSRGGGALTDAAALSVQAGYESMMTLMATYEAGTNLIFHSSGIMNSYSYISPEKLMIDFEIVAMVKRYFEGIRIDEERLAVETVQEVGISGEFLTCEHTLAYMREELLSPDIGLRGVPAKEYEEKLTTRIYEKIQRLLSVYHRPDWDTATLRRMKDYLLEIGIDEKILDAIILEQFE